MQELLNLNKATEWILKSESNILNCCSSLQCSLDDTSICLQISWSFEIRKYNTLVIIGVSLAWMIWPISVASFSSLLVCDTQVSITASVAEQYVWMANGDASCCYLPSIHSSIISVTFLFSSEYFLICQPAVGQSPQVGILLVCVICGRSSCSACFSLLSWVCSLQSCLHPAAQLEDSKNH